MLTDLRDEAAAGYTIGDGAATAPAPGWWRGILLRDGADGSQISGMTVRYAGRLGPAVVFSACDATLTDCVAELNQRDGFELDATSRPSLTGCAALDNGGQAFDNVSLLAVPAFSALTASGNEANWLQTTVSGVPAGTSVTIGPGNLPGGVLRPANAIAVPSGAELVLVAGTIVKMSPSNFFVVNGTLRCEGTLVSPVVVTDERDDSIGGDSNGDGGATSLAPGWWRGIGIFNPTSAGSVLEHTVVAYAGGSGFGMNLGGTSATLRDCVVRDCDTDGVTLSTTATPPLDGLTVTNCQGDALAAAPLVALANFSGLQFSGNDFDRVEVSAGVIPPGTDLTIGPPQTFGAVVVMNDGIRVDPGASLTLEAGTIVKFAAGQTCSVQGLLTANGTLNRRVAFTSIHDDSVGGDTNANGAGTTPMPGDWRGITFGQTSDGSAMSFTDVEYAGSTGTGLVVANASVTLNRCAVRHALGDGVNMGQTTKPGSFERLRVEDCTGTAIEGILFERLQDVEFAGGGGNGTNAIAIASGNVTANTTIELNNQFDGALLLRSSVFVPSGLSLSLEPGVTLKLGPGLNFFVQGALFTRGTLQNPVVITSLLDDSVAGDTNGDGGATTPAPGDWGTMTFATQATASLVNGLDLRYGGTNGVTLQCFSSSVRLREVTVAEGNGIGAQVTAHAGALERIVARDNTGPGFQLSATAFAARQLTAVGNAGAGITALGTYAGTVADSITWSNAGGATSGLGAGQFVFSNGDPGFAGADGNIDVDPLFVDEAGRDLRLTELSPCVDTGDPASPLDPDATPADMGAFFRNTCEPEVFCAQTTFPPCAPVLTYEGFASLSSPLPFTLTLDDAPTLSFAILFYGIGSRTQLPGLYGDVCVGGPYQRTQPVPSGGNPADGPCAGTFELDFNAYVQSGVDPAIVAGSNVIGHFWYRYGAAPGNARFSDAIEMPVCP